MRTTIDVICYKYKPLKNNELPLKLKITKDQKRKYINLDISVNPIRWDFIKNQPKPNCPNRFQIQKIIAEKIAEYRGKILELESENKTFTAMSLVSCQQEYVGTSLRDFHVIARHEAI